MDDPKLPIWTCVAPHVGLAVGAGIAWAAMGAAGRAPLDIPTVSGRMMSVALSILFWAIFTSMQGKKIYGGGTLLSRPEEMDRAKVVLGLYLLLGFLIVLFYASTQFVASGIATALLLVFLAGDLVRGSIWGLFKYG